MVFLGGKDGGRYVSQIDGLILHIINNRTISPQILNDKNTFTRGKFSENRMNIGVRDGIFTFLSKIDMFTDRHERTRDETVALPGRTHFEIFFFKEIVEKNIWSVQMIFHNKRSAIARDTCDWKRTE